MCKSRAIASCCVLPALIAAPADAGTGVQITVRVPDQTAGDGVVHVTGSHPSLGPWRPDGQAMTKIDDGRWRAQLELPPGFKLEYKFTLGDWASVEKDADGGEIHNRRVAIDGDAPVQIEDEVVAWADPSVARPRWDEPTITGTVRVHEKVESEELGNARTVSVYLPPGYDADDGRRYPVLYMHDGQNVFDASRSMLGIEWGADETAEALIGAGLMEPIIIVAIDNTRARMDEYAGAHWEQRDAGGRADAYARFLLERVKPMIDRTYRTLPRREHTAVAGSSLGGLVSLYLVEHHPDVFGRCAAMSPALQWAGGELTDRWAASPDRSWMKRTRFWIDVGTHETVGGTDPDQDREKVARIWIDQARRFVAVLDEAGLVPGRDYYYFEEFQAKHNEADWARRLPRVLRFLFPTGGEGE